MEVLLSMMIFGFIMVALTSIYSTIQRNVLQGYRQNVLKTNTTLAMRAIQQRLSEATRIDMPTFGGAGNELQIAVNVDQLTGCNPIVPGVPVSVHRFFISNGLYYCQGRLPVAAPCTNFPPITAPPVYTCVTGTLVLLLNNVSVSSGVLFSRNSLYGGVNERDTVFVNLRTFWRAVNPLGQPLPQNDVDYSLRTSVKINRPAMGRSPVE